MCVCKACLTSVFHLCLILNLLNYINKRFTYKPDKTTVISSPQSLQLTGIFFNGFISFGVPGDKTSELDNRVEERRLLGHCSRPHPTTLNIHKHA